MSRAPNVPHPIPPGIAAGEGDVRELLAALTAALPIAARGAALASVVLSDGAGVHSYRSPLDLGAAGGRGGRADETRCQLRHVTQLTETVNGATTSHGRRRCEMDASAGCAGPRLSAGPGANGSARTRDRHVMNETCDRCGPALTRGVPRA